MTEITLAEVAAVTGLPLDLVTELLQPADTVGLRELLFVLLLGEFCMLPPAHAHSIARQAALEAQPDGKRLLCVAWINGQPTFTWAAEVRPGLARTVLAIPAESMFASLGARLAAHRAWAVAPN